MIRPFANALKYIAIVAIGTLTCAGGLRSRVGAVEPPITAIAVSTDGKSVVVGSQSGIEVRTGPALARENRIPCDLDQVNDLAFSPDGKLLAVSGGTPGELGGLSVYSWPDRKLIGELLPHRDLIYAVDWSADARQLLSASGDQRVAIVSVDPTNSPPLAVYRMLTGHSRGILTVGFLPGSAIVVSAGMDETIRLWDVRSGETLRTLSNHTRPVIGIAVRPAADDVSPPLAASAGADRTVRFWQPTIGRMIRFARLESPPQAIAWSVDGKLLWAVCHDGRLRQIDPETAEVIRDLPATTGLPHALAVAPDGSLLVGGENGELIRILAEPPQG